MGEIDVVSIFDPELLIPSPEAVARLGFWYRLQQWVDDPRPRVGMFTFEALLGIVNNPPEVTGLPRAEFWSIISPLVARALDVETALGDENMCGDLVSKFYSPHHGDRGNPALLDDDLGLADYSGVVLATDRRCWDEESVNRHGATCDCRHPVLSSVPNGDYSAAWRYAYIRLKPADVSGIAPLAHELFPNLIFHDSAWNDVESLSRAPQDVVASLISHLGVLNDYAITIWEENLTADGKKSKLGSLGINASMESPKVHADKKAMRARRFSFDGIDIFCEWHTKLQRHRDRIYFDVHKDAVYVGAITKHL